MQTSSPLKAKREVVSTSLQERNIRKLHQTVSDLEYLKDAPSNIQQCELFGSSRVAINSETRNMLLDLIDKGTPRNIVCDKIETIVKVIRCDILALKADIFFIRACTNGVKKSTVLWKAWLHAGRLSEDQGVSQYDSFQSIIKTDAVVRVALDNAVCFCETSTQPHDVSHSSDFSSLNWFGARYAFAKGQQCKVVECLLVEWRKGSHGLMQETIQALIGSEADQFSMRKLFRTPDKKQQHSAWNTLIQSDGKGRYRLVEPDKKNIK